MLVGISTKEISSENSTVCYKYSVECILFCISFFVDIRGYYEPATFEHPENLEVNFDWDSFDLDPKLKIDQEEYELAMIWIDSHHDELEKALGKDYIEIETECK